jgi:hypothetical protein
MGLTWPKILADEKCGMATVASNHLFTVLDLYWRSPESGDLWQSKKTMCPLL